MRYDIETAMAINYDNLNLPISSARELDAAIRALGILPFFDGCLPHLSVQAMSDPSLWFNDEYDGPWEWKGPVIGFGHAAYGKFLRNKAVFMRLDVYADFVNYRRHTMPVSKQPVEALGNMSDAMLLRIISESGSILSSELKEMMGFGHQQRRQACELVDVLDLGIKRNNKVARSAIDAMLARLQMSGHVCIENFEYKRSSSGKRYGWGLARYTTPEALYSESELDCQGRTPLQSRQRLFDIITLTAPEITSRKVYYLVD